MKVEKKEATSGPVKVRLGDLKPGTFFHVYGWSKHAYLVLDTGSFDVRLNYVKDGEAKKFILLSLADDRLVYDNPDAVRQVVLLDGTLALRHKETE
jgi:hypothetical protein